MLKRLRIKFIVIMMTIISLMLMIILGLILHFTQRNFDINGMEIMRNTLMEQSAPRRPDGHQPFVPFPYFILGYDEAGEIFSNGGEDYFDLSDTAFLEELISKTEDTGMSGLLRSYKLRYMRVMTPDNGERIIFMDASSELSAMEGLIRNCVLIGAASLLVFFALSVFLARVIVKPVEQAWNQQRQFVADASHELKTPLAVISTNTELLCAPGYEAAEKGRFAENIAAVTKQMRSLVEGLLELARVDNGTMQMNMERLDMSALVSDALLLFEVLYYENGLSLESAVAENIYLKGSAQHISQLMEILLDNAMKYSHPGSCVKVRLERQSSHCFLTVENSGEAISHADLKNIFKRFYRADKARSAEGSYGLGLAIAESIVKAHKGRIWAESDKGTNRFFVRLPIASSAV